MIYHKDISLPRRIRGMVPTGVKSIYYSRHAGQEFYDKNGKIEPPSQLDFSTCDIVEVTTYGEKIDKLVLRKEYNDTHDLVVVLVPYENNKKNWFAKTVWLNSKTDTHKTLDVNRFPYKGKKHAHS
jgi:hypothetical protein